MLKETEPLKRALEEAEGTPMKEGTEFFLFADGWVVPGWREAVESHHFGGTAEAHKAAVDFLGGFSWVQAYYWASDDVNVSWYYPHSEAPTFQTLATALRTEGLRTHAGATEKERKMVSAVEQLVMVLPPQSHGLLPPAVKKGLEGWPEFCPADFQLNMFGKRFLWECEPIIPFLPRRIAEQIVNGAA